MLDMFSRSEQCKVSKMLMELLWVFGELQLN